MQRGFIFKDKEQEAVSAIAVEIKQRIDGLRLPHKASDISECLTVSIGQHYGQWEPVNIYEGLKNAADALYKAKIRGRNQIASV